MADNRKIKATVRVGGKSYGPGQEDELAATLPESDGQRHLESGALEGKWEFTGEKPTRPLPRLSLPLASAGVMGSTMTPASASESVFEEGIRSELEATKTQLQEALSGSTRLQNDLTSARQIIETGKAENKRQHDELVELRPLKRENSALKAKATKAENDLNELKVKPPAAAQPA